MAKRNVQSHSFEYRTIKIIPKVEHFKEAEKPPEILNVELFTKESVFENDSQLFHIVFYIIYYVFASCYTTVFSL